MAVPSMNVQCSYSSSPPGCVTMPGGGQVCPPTGRLGFQSDLRTFLAWLGDFMKSFAPMMPLAIFLKVFADILVLIQAIITLDPVKIAAAAGNLGNDVITITGLLPPAAFPIMAKGLVQMIAFGFDSLDRHIVFLLSQQARIQAQIALAAKTGNASMANMAQCNLNAFNSRVAALNASLSVLTFVFGIVKLILCLAVPGIAFSPPALPLPLDPNALAAARAPIQALRDFFAALALLIPSTSGSQLTC